MSTSAAEVDNSLLHSSHQAICFDHFHSLNFPRAAILKSDVFGLQCQTPTRSLLSFLSRVETGTANHTRYISRWRGPQEIEAMPEIIKANRLG